MSNAPLEKSSNASSGCEIQHSKKCPRCGSSDYIRKLSFDMEGVTLTVCNVCAPDHVEVPLEVQQDDMLITTGTFRAQLDWNRENIVVRSENVWRKKSRWERAREWFHRLVAPEAADT